MRLRLRDGQNAPPQLRFYFNDTLKLVSRLNDTQNLNADLHVLSVAFPNSSTNSKQEVCGGIAVSIHWMAVWVFRAIPQF